MVERKVIVTLTGWSCAGKTTLERDLAEHHGFSRIIGTTTRPQRAGEVAGVDYVYMSDEHFQQALVAGDFVECVHFNGFHYGVLRSSLEYALGQGDSVAVLEPDGVRQYREYAQEHNIPIVSAFLGGTHPDSHHVKSLVTERMYERCVNGEWSPESFVSRLGYMLNHESKWYNRHVYDVQFPCYSQHDAGRIINEILSRVDQAKRWAA